MARINPIAPQQAQGKSRELLDAVREKLGMVPNLIKTMAHSPATLGAYLGMSGALADGKLSPREREQISLSIAETNGCNYCLAAHSAIGKLAGLSELEIRDARLGTSPSSRDNAILTFAREVMNERGRVSHEALTRIRQAGLDDGEITEIIAGVALNFFTNSLNLVAQTELDFPAAATLETVNG